VPPTFPWAAGSATSGVEGRSIGAAPAHIGDEEVNLGRGPSSSCSESQLKKNRSDGRLVQSEIRLKPWIAQTPTVAEARPAACPGCKAASCPVGGRIQIHGHGLRERQVRGPLGPGEKALTVGVPGRRYRCVVCGAVFLVVPREVLPRRQYSAEAIGFALALWGLVKATALAVRLQISPSSVIGFEAMTGWVTLRRWAKAVKNRCLFSSVPAAGPSATLRDVASLAATALAASADPTTRHLPLEQRAFLGAAHAA
jgi:hypothetical protein